MTQSLITWLRICQLVRFYCELLPRPGISLFAGLGSLENSILIAQISNMKASRVLALSIARVSGVLRQVKHQIDVREIPHHTRNVRSLLPFPE
jgi:hypothetical protein